jgi:hypothetical protein
MVTGPSGSGKSTFATGLVERLLEREAQLLVIDPEGDYRDLPGVPSVGSAERTAGTDEVLEALGRPEQSAAVSLLGLKLEARPEYFESLFARLLELRRRTGRPHWILADEAHHLLPLDRKPALELVRPDLQGMLWITVHPDHVAQALLESVDHVVVVGRSAARTLASVAERLGRPAPAPEGGELGAGDAILWRPASGEPPLRIATIPPRAERRRHVRKYAEGDLGEDRSFYFRGPGQRLKLRAPNLTVFLQLAEGVDDETWLHHLARGDYSQWFRECIKDPELAEEAARIEAEPGSAAESRARIRELVTGRYTLPA